MGDAGTSPTPTVATAVGFASSLSYASGSVSHGAANKEQCKDEAALIDGTDCLVVVTVLVGCTARVMISLGSAAASGKGDATRRAGEVVRGAESVYCPGCCIRGHVVVGLLLLLCVLLSPNN